MVCSSDAGCCLWARHGSHTHELIGDVVVCITAAQDQVNLNIRVDGLYDLQAQLHIEELLAMNSC